MKNKKLHYFTIGLLILIIPVLILGLLGTGLTQKYDIEFQEFNIQTVLNKRSYGELQELIDNLVKDKIQLYWNQIGIVVLLIINIIVISLLIIKRRKVNRV